MKQHSYKTKQLNILKLIVRENLIRLYDVLAIIIFSAAVNIVTTGIMDSRNKCGIDYFLLFLAFLFLIISGWCFYWLFENVKLYLQRAMGVEMEAINLIVQLGLAGRFQRYFLSGILAFIIGIITLITGRIYG